MKTKQNMQSGKQFNKKQNQNNMPVKPDKNPDITKLKPEVNEPDKIDPIKIEQPSKAEDLDSEKNTSEKGCCITK